MIKINQGERAIDKLIELIQYFDTNDGEVNIILTEGVDIRNRTVRHVNQFDLIPNQSETMMEMTDKIISYLWVSCPSAKYKAIGNGSYAYIPLNGKRVAGVKKIMSEYKDKLYETTYDSILDSLDAATEAFIIPVEEEG